MTSSQSSLRDRQIRSIERMLNLNHDAGGSTPHNDQVTSGLGVPSAPILNSEGDPIWKVLVFDDLGRDVISSVLRVNDLRTWGVTMHMHIASQRHPIPDVPVLYLVEPTHTNLQIITSDLSKGLYSPAYVNFLHSIPRPILEDFAKQTAEAGTAEHIAQFYDQYLNFIVAEPNLFSLGMNAQNTYWTLNSSKTTDDESDKVIDRAVSGLFSVMVTMGVMPIIRCPKGGAAEQISMKLDRKLRDHILNSKDNLFSASANRPATSTGTPSSRPVLIVLDRNIDLIPMLSHSWTYQSLVNDVLKMKLNRITVETSIDEQNSSKGSTKKGYDLTSNDFFWTKNAGKPFPQVAEDIDAELMRYRDDANEVTKKTGASSIEDLQNDTSASAQHLKAAITLLPELRERKAILDMHMNILGGLLTGIKNRQLDSYFELGENITKQTKAQMLELLNDSAKGSEPMDKLRIFVIWFLSTEQDISRAELDRFEEALKTAGADTRSLAYVKGVRTTTRLTMLTAPSSTSAPTPSTSFLPSSLSTLSTRLTHSLKDTGLAPSLPINIDSLINNVRNYLPTNRDLTITKITESIMDPSAASSSAIAKTEGYLYFDPRSANARGAIPPPGNLGRRDGMAGSFPSSNSGEKLGGGGIQASFGMRRQGFSEGVVFVVGGGSLDEYGNLQEWVKRSGGGGGSDGPGRNAGAGSGSGGAGGPSSQGHGQAPKRRVVYGATEVVSAREFLETQLERLGDELSGNRGSAGI